MYRFCQILAGAIALLASTACTNLTPSQCAFNDWYAMGSQAAAEQLPMSVITQHQADCVQHGIVPDRNQFIAGYRSAIVSTGDNEANSAVLAVAR